MYFLQNLGDSSIFNNKFEDIFKIKIKKELVCLTTIYVLLLYLNGFEIIMISLFHFPFSSF